MIRCEIGRFCRIKRKQKEVQEQNITFNGVGTKEPLSFQPCMLLFELIPYLLVSPRHLEPNMILRCSALLTSGSGVNRRMTIED